MELSLSFFDAHIDGELLADLHCYLTSEEKICLIFYFGFSRSDVVTNSSTNGVNIRDGDMNMPYLTRKSRKGKGENTNPSTNSYENAITNASTELRQW